MNHIWMIHSLYRTRNKCNLSWKAFGLLREVCYLKSEYALPISPAVIVTYDSLLIRFYSYELQYRTQMLNCAICFERLFDLQTYHLIRSEAAFSLLRQALLERCQVCTELVQYNADQ